jgi:hypothetical protein
MNASQPEMKGREMQAKKDMTVVNVNLAEVLRWARDCVNPYMIAVRPPAAYEKIGIPADVLQPLVEQHRYLRLNDGSVGPGCGVSDAVVLRILLDGLGADCSAGNRWLSISNKIEAQRAALIARIEEIAPEVMED